MARSPALSFGEAYVSEAIIGKGMGGEVWRAVDRNGHVWAVKVIDDVESAMVEYSYGRILRHPCLCASYEMFIEDGRGRLVMELMDLDLFDVVKRRGPLNVRDARIVGARVCRGLAYMHERGTVHRDVKPENIMIHDDRVDTCKLVDFGLSEDREMSNKIRGTPGFIAPEVTNRNRPRLLDERVDVYSLGATLFFLMTGTYLTSAYPTSAYPTSAYPTSTYLTDGITNGMDPDLCEIVSDMTVSDPNRRPFARELIVRLERRGR